MLSDVIDRMVPCTEVAAHGSRGLDEARFVDEIVSGAAKLEVIREQRRQRLCILIFEGREERLLDGNNLLVVRSATIPSSSATRLLFSLTA
jgi:hypothetical protein